MASPIVHAPASHTTFDLSQHDYPIVMYDQAELQEDETMFVPGDIFRDDALSGPEDTSSNLDAWVASVESQPQTLPELLSVLDRYMTTNQWERMEQVWDACTTVVRDSRSYGLLMRSFAERPGKSDRAESEFHNMATANLKPTGQVYANLMLAHWRDGHSSRVMEIVEDVKSKPELSFALKDVRTMMQALYGTSLDAAEFIATMTPILAKARNLSPKSPTMPQSVEMEMYGYAISKSLAKLDLEAANLYAAKILASKVTLFTKTIAHVAKWYIAKGQLDVARHFINHAVLKDRAPHAAGLSQPSLMPPRLSILLLELAIRSSENKELDSAAAVLPQFYALFSTYRTRDALALGIFMTRILFQHRLFKEMFEVADRIEASLGSSVALTRIFNLRMRAHIYLHETDKALEMLARMQNDHIHKPNAHTSTVLVKMTSNLYGCFEAKELLLSIIRDIGTPPVSAFRAVITAFCKEAKVEEATQIIELMRTHGLRVTWSDYTPIFDVYERLNLLGKQFTLYSELLTVRLPNEVPSPDLTARLIFGCLRQKFLAVAHSIVGYVNSHNIPFSTALVGALIELFYQSNDTQKLTQLAEFAISKMTGDGSAIEKRNFATLAIYAYSYLQRPNDALEILDKLRKASIPLNINVFNAILACYIKNKRLDDARRFFDRCEQDFGPIVAKQTAINSTSTAFRIILFKPNEFEKVRDLWKAIVRASKRSARLSSRTSQSSKSTSGDVLPNIRDEKALEGGKGESEFDEMAETISELTTPVESEISEEVVQEAPKVPLLTLKLALSVMQQAQQHLDTNASFALDVARVCREFKLAQTQMMYVVEAQALVRINHPKRLLELFGQMQASHFNMRHEFYHAVMYEASKHPFFKHKIAIAIMQWMESKSGTLSAKPNETTWNMLLMCVSPREMGQFLKAYLDAGYTFNEKTMQSVARNLLVHQKPLDSAINDTFVLLDWMHTTAHVSPSSETLLSLFDAVTRDVALPAWLAHFHHLISRLHAQGTLNWPSKDILSAINILTYRQKYVWNKTPDEKRALKMEKRPYSKDTKLARLDFNTKHVDEAEKKALALTKLLQLLEEEAKDELSQPLPTLVAHKLNLSAHPLPPASDEHGYHHKGPVRGVAGANLTRDRSYRYPSSSPGAQSPQQANRKKTSPTEIPSVAGNTHAPLQPPAPQL